MDDSLIVEIMSSFSTPPVVGVDRYFSPATRLDWGWMDSMRELCEGDITYPSYGKGLINYDAKVVSTRKGRGKSHVF
jgi:hypothetical protein